jgi:hypothetical protein
MKWHRPQAVVQGSPKLKLESGPVECPEVQDILVSNQDKTVLVESHLRATFPPGGVLITSVRFFLA